MSTTKCWLPPFSFVDCQGISVPVTTDDDASACFSQGGRLAVAGVSPGNGTASDWYQAGYCSQDLYDYAQGNQGNTATPTNEQQEAIAKKLREEAESGEPVTISKEDVKAYEEAMAAQQSALLANALFPGNYTWLAIGSDTTRGLISAPLSFTWASVNSVDDAEINQRLSAGEVAVARRTFLDTAQQYTFNQTLLTDYWGVAADAGNADISVSFDLDNPNTNSNRGSYIVTYSSAEKQKLRDQFGSPKNSTAESIIDSAIAAAAGKLSLFEGPQRYKSNAVETPAFTNANLSVLTGMESAQGIDVSLTTTKTRISDTETQVESTVDYKTGDMY